MFLPIAALPDEALFSWGWRIPFWLSLIVVIVGYIIRRTLAETPAFEEEKRSGEIPRLPLAVLFRHYSPDVARVIFAALVSVVSTIFQLYSLTYAVNTVGLPRSTMLWVVILANIIALGAIPAWAVLSDRIGRKPVFLIGALGCSILIWPYLYAISRKNLPLIFLVGLALSGVVYSAANGIWPSLYGEQFSTRVRLSGMAIGTQIGFALGGFAPAIAAALQGGDVNGWIPVAIFTTAATWISSLSVLTFRETYNLPLSDLGRREVVAPAAR